MLKKTVWRLAFPFSVFQCFSVSAFQRFSISESLIGMSPLPELIIEPGRAEKNYWRDLWRYRELFYFLAWRDILVRYKQTVIGIAWALVRPLLTMIVFTFVFSKIAKLPAPGSLPYALMVSRPCCPGNSFRPR